MYYDKQGRKIDNILDWAAKLEDDNYRVVAQDVVKKKYYISTVWLGIDHNLSKENGKPVIFETMVFKKFEKDGDVEQIRYCTLQEAKKGHKKLVAKYSK